MTEDIRTLPFPDCPACGTPGKTFYTGLQDVFFHVPGSWDSKKCPNPVCGLVWLDPMPLKEDLLKMYEGYLISHEDATDCRTRVNTLYGHLQKGYWANRYGYRDSVSVGERILGWAAYLHPGWRSSLDANVLFLKKKKGGRLLEIGSGAGRQLKIMQEMGWRAEGLDADAEAVEKARSKGLTVSHGYIEDQHFPDETFDAIIMNHVIEHVYEPGPLFRELRRILKTGGQLVMLAPNMESLGQKLFRHADVMFMDTPRHLYGFTPGSMRIMAEGAGFTKTRVFTSIKQAGYLYMTDKAIERTGYYKIKGSPPFRDRAGAALTLLREWALIKIKPGIGEEVVFVGEK